MRVRISFVVEVDDEFRRALRSYYGKDGLATRKEIKSWYRQNADSVDEDMLAQYHHEEREE